MSKRVVVRVPDVLPLPGVDGLAVALTPLVTASFDLAPQRQHATVNRVGANRGYAGPSTTDPILLAIDAATHGSAHPTPDRVHVRSALSEPRPFSPREAEAVAGAAGADAALSLRLEDDDIIAAASATGSDRAIIAAAFWGGIAWNDHGAIGHARNIHDDLALVTARLASTSRESDQDRAPAIDPAALGAALASGNSDDLAAALDIPGRSWVSPALEPLRNAAITAGALAFFADPASPILAIVTRRADVDLVIDALGDSALHVAFAVAPAQRSTSATGTRVSVQQVCEDDSSLTASAAGGAHAH